MYKTTNAHARPVDDNWRAWVAENLMLDTPPAVVADMMVRHGIAQGTARAEVERAMRSPYLRGAGRLKRRLSKRDWALDIQCKLNRLRPATVERRERLSGDEFFEHYYTTNRPVIITGMIDQWPAFKHWNLDHFRGQYGDCEVEVQFDRDADPDYELNSIAHKKRISMREYVDLIKARSPTNNFYMTANNDAANRRALDGLWTDITQIPEYLDGNKPGGFFWLGPAGTITPFHHDLTNNFMAQVIGRKRLRLVAACQLHRMYNTRHCFTPVDGRDIDVDKFPAMADAQVMECVIEPGDVLFLPVGMWHFVEALDVSVTMTFTNFRWDNDFYSQYPDNRDF